MALPYAPKHSIASEEEMNTIEKQKLQHKYTFWAMIREQNYKNKDNFDENKLVEIESCDTVSTLSFDELIFLNIFIGTRLLDGISTFEKTYCHAIWHLFTRLQGWY